MLDEKKLLMIELLLDGDKPKTEIKKILGISRQTLYNWMDLPEVKEQMDKRRQQFENLKNVVNDVFVQKIMDIQDEYYKLITTSDNDMVKKQGMEFWMERVLGKLTNKHEVTAEAKTGETVSQDLLEQEFEEYEAN